MVHNATSKPDSALMNVLHNSCRTLVHTYTHTSGSLYLLVPQPWIQSQIENIQEKKNCTDQVQKFILVIISLMIQSNDCLYSPVSS